MSARRLAAALLALAAQRWPAEARADLYREWLAELHVLAAEGRPARMVSYALSLAASRPAADPRVDRSLMTRRFWITAATMLLAPVLCVALLAVAVLAVNLGATALRLDRIGEQMAPLFTLAAGVLTVPTGLLATRLGARTALHGRARLATALVLPSVVVIALVTSLLGSADKVVRVVPELLWWGAGMVAVLWAAGTLASRGQVRAAWWAGVLGAFAVADIGIAITVLNHTGPYVYVPGGDGSPGGYDGVNRLWAPLWLLTVYSGGMHGLPGPGEWEVNQVADATELTPFLYLIFGAYLLAYAIRAGRGGAVQPSAASVPPSPDSPAGASIGSGSISA